MAREQKAEIRQSYVHNRMVIIAPSRGSRPHNVADTSEKLEIAVRGNELDPFSVESLRGVNALLTLKGPAKPWTVKVIRNIYPAVSLDNPNVYGTQEVVVETPEGHVDLGQLPVEHIEKVFEAYQIRTKILSKDPKIQYILIFKNVGGRAGASLDHAHSQIFAAGFVPPHVIEKLRRAEEYKIQRGRAYYMDLLARERGGPRWILEEGGIAAFAPYASYYNYEVWIMPTRRVDNVTQLTNAERHALAKTLKYLLEKIADLGLPYNFYLHQVVQYDEEHLYIRLAPRKSVWAGVELGTRLVINSVAPEEAAKYYRGRKKEKTSKKMIKSRTK